ncbi:unnamed protein product [Penicillium glandicola]
MNARERLMMLLEGDMGLMDLDTGLNKSRVVQTPPGAHEADPVAESAESNKAKKGVSGYSLPVDFEPENGMQYPASGQFPLSYIRTHVVGELVESEDKHLTQINQDDCTPRRIPKIHLDLSDLRKDERGSGTSNMDSDEEPVTAIPVVVSFTPAVAMARFPFIYLQGKDSKRVDERFYRGDKFWNRTWDLYYLSVPRAISQTALLLIPTFQAQALLDEINLALNLKLTLTGSGKEGLVVEFNNETLAHPLYLGRSSTRARKVELERDVPSPPESWGPWSQLVELHVFEDFEKKIKESVATIKTKKNNNNNDKQAARDARTKKLQECLGRMQAHFGLRPALQPNGPQPSFANGQIEAIDVLKPVKWAFQDAPIFISVDLEWMNHSDCLTEVGISTLDMMDLEGVVPGDYGQMWLSQVRSRHLRVKEYRHWVNQYPIGCPDKFRFGSSELIPSAEIANVVDATFRPPFMVPLEGEKIAPHKNQKRTVILVGLDLYGDIAHLQRAGSQVFINLNETSSVIRETIDVAQLYRVAAGEDQGPGLRTLLGFLNILGLDLHNAGNDAYYTLHALVRLMLRVAGEKQWGYEDAEVGDEEPNVKRGDEHKDKRDRPDFESMAAKYEKVDDNTDRVTVNPKDQRKDNHKHDVSNFESMASIYEEADANTDGDPVWRH